VPVDLNRKYLPSITSLFSYHTTYNTIVQTVTSLENKLNEVSIQKSHGLVLQLRRDIWKVNNTTYSHNSQLGLQIFNQLHWMASWRFYWQQSCYRYHQSEREQPLIADGLDSQGLYWSIILVTSFAIFLMNRYLLISSSVSDILHHLAIFNTSLISLLPVFHTEDAICITAFGLSFLINLSAIPSNSS
jgi:hypothetical protein